MRGEYAFLATILIYGIKETISTKPKYLKPFYTDCYNANAFASEVI